MGKINRRRFIQTSAAGLAGFATLTSSGLQGKDFSSAPATIDKVKLGKTGLTVSRVAMGTGSTGGNHQSNQTRLGLSRFVQMAHHAYDRGIHFFDTADSYGSYPFVREVFKEVPREKVTLLGKMWTYNDSSGAEQVDKALDRFRTETGSDYFDIMLLHCMMNGKWPEEKKRYIDYFSKAKQDGILKAVGVSCHNIDALRIAADDPWVDVILSRINPFQAHMDGTPAEINSILERARNNGKGIIGMKIFGNGDKVLDNEREESITFALKKSNIHCMTLGMESIAHIDDAVDRVMRVLRS
jgi:predicted aldo/keto reductase-like oxidoreductase